MVRPFYGMNFVIPVFARPVNIDVWVDAWARWKGHPRVWWKWVEAYGQEGSRGHWREAVRAEKRTRVWVGQGTSGSGVSVPLPESNSCSAALAQKMDDASSAAAHTDRNTAYDEAPSPVSLVSTSDSVIVPVSGQRSGLHSSPYVWQILWDKRPSWTSVAKSA